MNKFHPAHFYANIDFGGLYYILLITGIIVLIDVVNYISNISG